jgi:hypothetical protein
MNTEENEKWQTYGSRSYYVQILQDLAQEPHEICNIDKRRKCDSYYIALYNKLKTHYIKLLKEYSDCKEELETYKQLLSVYKEVSIDITNKVTGKVVK